MDIMFSRMETCERLIRHPLLLRLELKHELRGHFNDPNKRSFINSPSVIASGLFYIFLMFVIL